MIVNPILNSGDKAIIGIVLCGMLVLAAIILPKVIRYKKRMKAKQDANPNDVEILVVQEPDSKNSIDKQEKEEPEMKGQNEQENTLDYRATFLIAPKITDRQPVFVSKAVRDQLNKIARRLGNRKMSVSGFLENMAKHHLEEYRDEIDRLYKE